MEDIKVYQPKYRQVVAAKVSQKNLEMLASWCGGKVHNVATGGKRLEVPHVDGNFWVINNDYLVFDESNGRFHKETASVFEGEWAPEDPVKNYEWSTVEDYEWRPDEESEPESSEDESEPESSEDD